MSWGLGSFWDETSRLDDWVSWSPQILLLLRLGRLKTASDLQQANRRSHFPRFSFFLQLQIPYQHEMVNVSAPD